MNFKRRALWGVIPAMMIALSLQANAETYKATFTLDSPVQWGQRLLMPGEYVVVTGTAPFDRMLYVTGNGTTTVIPAIAVETDRPGPAKAELQLSEVDGRQVVTKLSAASAGKVYEFAISRPKMGQDIGAVALKKVIRANQ